MIWPEQQPKHVFHQIECVNKSTWKVKTQGGILVFRVLVQVCPHRHFCCFGHIWKKSYWLPSLPALASSSRHRRHDPCRGWSRTSPETEEYIKPSRSNRLSRTLKTHQHFHTHQNPSNPPRPSRPSIHFKNLQTLKDPERPPGP